MTLLLGPPASGKTTLLLALAGKLDSSLKVLFFFFTLLKLSSNFSITFSSLVLSLIRGIKMSHCRFLVGRHTMGTTWVSLCPREQLLTSVNMIII